MIFTATRLADAFVIDVEFHADERGFLAGTFCEDEFAEQGLPMRIVQSSTIHSPHRHTLRGLHYQEAFAHPGTAMPRCRRTHAKVGRAPSRWMDVTATTRAPASSSISGSTT
jgi:dTDP-4-dehydrorhamnose 3,5-epimerase